MDPFTIDKKPEMVIELMNERCILHNLIVCDFPNNALLLDHSLWSDYLKYVTGLDYSWEKLNLQAEIIETLIRKANLREGMTCDDDVLPKRIIEESLKSGPARGKIIGMEKFLKMRTEYYEFRGWDKNGVPKPSTLDNYQYDNDSIIKIA
jgi:aldehyde:ferredoxin oxidoreductase